MSQPNKPPIALQSVERAPTHQSGKSCGRAPARPHLRQTSAASPSGTPRATYRAGSALNSRGDGRPTETWLGPGYHLRTTPPPTASAANAAAVRFFARRPAGSLPGDCRPMKRFCTAHWLSGWRRGLGSADRSRRLSPSDPGRTRSRPRGRRDQVVTHHPPRRRADADVRPAQKAQARGAQRMARLEAMRWYGFSNSRPTATGYALDDHVQPGLATPGGRPFAWYDQSRPVGGDSAYPTPLYR